MWREYNGRAACEGVIKELDAGYGLPQLASEMFWATEAALSFGVLAHNLVVLFELKLGWQEAVAEGSLLYWLFVTAGILSQPRGQTSMKLAVPPKDRDGRHACGTSCCRLFPTAMHSTIVHPSRDDPVEDLPQKSNFYCKVMA